MRVRFWIFLCLSTITVSLFGADTITHPVLTTFSQSAHIASAGNASRPNDFPNGGLQVTLYLQFNANSEVVDSQNDITTGMGGAWDVEFEPLEGPWPYTGAHTIKLFTEDYTEVQATKAITINAS
jgi:hypothetical protein